MASMQVCCTKPGSHAGKQQSRCGGKLGCRSSAAPSRIICTAPPPPRKVLQQVSESMNDQKKHKPNIGRGQGFHAGFAGFGPFEQVFQAGSKKSKKNRREFPQG